MKRFVVGLLATVTLVLALGAQQPARADAQVDEIFARVRQLNPGMTDYQADIDIALKAKVAFLPYNPRMTGSYYHKRPDKHKLVLEKAPSYVKKYPNIFGWNLPKLEKFNSRVAEQVDLNGQPTWHITLTPKQGMGDIQLVEIWVNRNDYSIPGSSRYKNNGSCRWTCSTAWPTANWSSTRCPRFEFLPSRSAPPPRPPTPTTSSPGSFRRLLQEVAGQRLTADRGRGGHLRALSNFRGGAAGSPTGPGCWRPN